MHTVASSVYKSPAICSSVKNAAVGKKNLKKILKVYINRLIAVGFGSSGMLYQV